MDVIWEGWGPSVFPLPGHLGSRPSPGPFWLRRLTSEPCGSGISFSDLSASAFLPPASPSIAGVNGSRPEGRSKSSPDAWATGFSPSWNSLGHFHPLSLAAASRVGLSTSGRFPCWFPHLLPGSNPFWLQILSWGFLSPFCL